MAIATYSELQSAVQNWLHRGDLSSRIPEFITLGEEMINNRLRIPEDINTTTLNPSQTVRYLALPSGFRSLISFTDDYGDELQQVTAADLESAAYAANAQRPELFRIADKIWFERIADDSYDYTFSYYKGLDIETDLTNTVLTKYPSLYLYGSLLSAEPFLDRDQRITVWSQMFDQALAAANRDQKNMMQLRTDIPMAGGSYNIYADR